MSHGLHRYLDPDVDPILQSRLEMSPDYYRPLPYICRRCAKNRTDAFFCEVCREEINEKASDNSGN